MPEKNSIAACLPSGITGFSFRALDLLGGAQGAGAGSAMRLDLVRKRRTTVAIFENRAMLLYREALAPMHMHKPL